MLRARFNWPVLKIKVQPVIEYGFGSGPSNSNEYGTRNPAFTDIQLYDSAITYTVRDPIWIICVRSYKPFLLHTVEYKVQSSC